MDATIDGITPAIRADDVRGRIQHVTTASMPALTDRPADFAYGYRMRCECGGASDLSADDYAAEVDEAHMPCSPCGNRIHFGRAVIALRDPADPALDNGQLNRFAWYHTSTSPDWPSPTYAQQQRQALTRGIPSMREEGVARLSNLALHVGTYEAAIENMLRRMRNQSDADSKFFLYRVALDLDPQRVEAGYRDENLQPAAQLSSAELREQGFQAVRYLNVYESPGSLSLAVIPDAITAVQVVDLDAHGLVPDHDAHMSRQLSAFQSDLDELRSRPPTPTDRHMSVLEQLQARVEARRGKTVGVNRSGAEFGELWKAVESALAERYLLGVNAIVARGFSSAVRARRRHDDGDVWSFADFYATRAFVLTHPSQVVAWLSTQPAAVPSASRTEDPMGRSQEIPIPPTAI
ncbi:hypothetical protein ACLQ2S_25005 [Micromonospora sp. DT48]|uniref:hypothetical protein n=1 Tax=Micromonospora sp. DT48 TaxID=3393429 RepID=UPI003CF21F7F